MEIHLRINFTQTAAFYPYRRKSQDLFPRKIKKMPSHRHRNAPSAKAFFRGGKKNITNDFIIVILE
jgi:hypothetical protein